MTSVPPSIVAANLKIISGGGIIGIVDLKITKWRFEFRQCRWRKDGDRERIELPCDCGRFWNHGDARRFQQAALAAVRELAKQQLHMR
jgi:hypothetical protein